LTSIQNITILIAKKANNDKDGSGNWPINIFLNTKDKKLSRNKNESIFEAYWSFKL
jgi:hypothetical protein